MYCTKIEMKTLKNYLKISMSPAGDRNFQILYAYELHIFENTIYKYDTTGNEFQIQKNKKMK